MVDPANSIIDVIGHDGAARRLNITSLSALFRWPVEGEEWMIEEQNGQWALGERVLASAPDDRTVDTNILTPGDIAVDLPVGKKIITSNYNVTTPAGLPDYRVTHTIPRKYSEIIGDGTATSFLIAHLLGTRSVVISISEAFEGGQPVNLDVVSAIATDYITLVFFAAPTINEFLVTVIG
jgi:hypothetical protein